MNRKLVSIAVGVCALASLLAAPAVQAQDIEQTMRESQQQMKAWLTAMIDFTAKTEFDEGDAKSLITHWQSLNELEDLKGMGEDNQPVDFQKILKAPEYKTWASANGVDGDDFMKKSMRIVAVVMRGQMLQGLTQSESMMPQQMQMMEAQKGQLGDEMYQKMMQGMQSAMTMMTETKALAEKLPVGTEKEQKILEKYGPQIQALMDQPGGGNMMGDE